MLETSFYMEIMVENKDKLGARPNSLNRENWLWVYEISIYSKAEILSSGMYLLKLYFPVWQPLAT